uniref:Palmitoyltransferase n=1 Tax=Romanomermis culicivorax TaxID=13658 RepID=A0A915I1T2_ROMCU
MKFAFRGFRRRFAAFFASKCRNFDQFYDKYVLEPTLNFMSNYMNYFGPIFVALILILVALIILVAYLIIVPYEYVKRSPAESISFTLLGHFILINFLYNYIKACSIGPGHPPKNANFKYGSSCKHCQHPKPFRAHHCSICQKCILKMDHHCPWLNQCVGHFNHRYFYLTLLYVFIGCIFLFVFTLRPFSDHYHRRFHIRYNFFPVDEITPWCDVLPNLLYSSYFCDSESKGDEKIYNLIIFEFSTSVAFGLGIGIMLVWNSLLISKGETSIERLSNKDQAKKMKQMGKDYKNPHDFGFRNNWKIFFGVEKAEEIWLKILLPCCRNNKLDGDGITWNYSAYVNDGKTMLV